MGKEDLMPRKRRHMVANDRVARTFNMVGGNFSLCETVTIVIGGEVKPVSELSGLGQADVDATSPVTIDT